ncbi:hypothetical protein ACLOJK_008963 [Asimina triloba]
MEAALHRPNPPSFFYSNPQNNDQTGTATFSHSNASSLAVRRPPPSPPIDEDPDTTEKWATRLLRDCAKAMFDKDSTKIHHQMWMLNELASPYGDSQQKLAAHFLQALFCKVTEAGDRCYKTLLSVAEKSYSFECARKVILKFQEVSPWTTFGHVASNGAILEVLEGHKLKIKLLHIIDISNTYCTQWPTLLEALATRSDDTPQLRLTAVVTPTMAASIMREIGQRMVKFARLMGVPFEFQVVGGLARLGELSREELGVCDDEDVIAVNCIGSMRRADFDGRGSVVKMIKSLRPKVVTVVEEEADFSSCQSDFSRCFEECLRFYSLFFGMLEESFAPTSNERLKLERECSRSLIGVLACDGGSGGECEVREKGIQWCGRLKEAFSPMQYSDDVVDDVKALLKRYRSSWSIEPAERDGDHGLYLKWKEEAVVWASVWKPA